MNNNGIYAMLYRYGKRSRNVLGRIDFRSSSGLKVKINSVHKYKHKTKKLKCVKHENVKRGVKSK